MKGMCCMPKKVNPSVHRCHPQVVIRSFGTYNPQLWDDVFSDFAPLTAKDVILVNFGAWYPRFKASEPGAPWVQWQADMAAMLRDKLTTTPARVLWKDYSPSHFSGGTGTFTGIEEGLKEVPSREKCEPAAVGEFWCARAPPSPALQHACMHTDNNNPFFPVGSPQPEAVEHSRGADGPCNMERSQQRHPHACMQRLHAAS
jgi:hypothetical protein